MSLNVLEFCPDKTLWTLITLHVCEQACVFMWRADPEDPEYVRQLRRPAEVKEDVRLMEDRKRVSLIMKTKAFRDELEQIVTETLRSGSHPTSLFALQQISELILPSSNLSQTSVLSRGESNGRRVTFPNNNNNIYFFYSAIHRYKYKIKY